MTLQSSGQITLSDIQTEYTRTDPNLKAYYGASTGIPTSGKIGIKDFYGASSVPPFDGVLIDKGLVNKQSLLEPVTLDWLKTPIPYVDVQWDIVIDGIACQAKCWNLPIDLTNVNNGSGNIFDMSIGRWKAVGTRFQITKDDHGYLRQIFDMGYMSTNYDTVISNSPYTPVPHLENNGGLHYTFYANGGPGGVVITDMSYAFHSEAIIKPRYSPKPWGQRVNLTANKYVYLTNDIDKPSGLVDILIYTKPPITFGYTSHQVKIELVNGCGTHLKKKTDYLIDYTKSPNPTDYEAYYHHNIIGYLQRATLSTAGHRSKVTRLPGCEATIGYNRLNALAARKTLVNFSNDGSISANDQITAHNGSTYSDWCSAQMGWGGMHWYRQVNWMGAGVYGRCYNGSGSNLDHLFGRTVSQFKLSII